VLTGLRGKGLEGITTGEGLQRIVEAPAAASVVAPGQAAKASGPEARPPVQQAAPAAQAPEAQAPAPAPEAQAPTAQTAEAQAVEEPLSLELSGVPQAAGPGLFRLPLTIRSGARTKSVVLSLALSLEEG
jgi:uncharacterized protein